MIKRHENIGIKQALLLEWMQKTTHLMMAGLDVKTIRQELHLFLADRKIKGSDRECSEQTRTFAVNNLMKTWVSPEPDLIPFRDASLTFLQEHPSMMMAVHWAMISATYPFWFNVARQTGRLLALQDKVTQAQIIYRLKEQYGDRQTISRYAKYIIRSFVAWGVLKDSATKGCYEKSAPVSVADVNMTILMLESALLAVPDGKGELVSFLNHPAFFPFKLPIITGITVSQWSERIEVMRFGLDDELLKLK